MAQSCFMKAEDKYFEIVTEVHHLRAIAVNARTSYTEMRKLFEDAAKLFYYISKSWPIRDRIIKQHSCKQCGTVYQVVKRFKCIVRIMDESCTAPLVVFDTNISKICGKFIWEITDKHPGEDTDKIILGALYDFNYKLWLNMAIGDEVLMDFPQLTMTLRDGCEESVMKRTTLVGNTSNIDAKKGVKLIAIGIGEPNKARAFAETLAFPLDMLLSSCIKGIRRF
ncbi:replication protein A 70 kDa DNA-binding subunit B [Tanacetum coccineum]